MSCFDDYYNTKTGDFFNSEDIPKINPSLFFNHIKELAQKINTFDSGMLCASSLEAYQEAHFIRLYEVTNGNLGTHKQYITAKKNLATWNELCLRLLGKIYTIDDMEAICKEMIAELGYSQLSND